ncbi:tyrosine-type recombinase/integrase [Carnobacterium divergens]|uniref:tyrosine-type recombinase/integrase n=1 Tax=Carnobacterium divergens TaxID=2748 RepID=UPI0023537FA1|nr:tyrosine-type recombinase/integrase [Carnobacterium divergens]
MYAKYTKTRHNVNLGYDYINHMLKVFIDKYKLEKITPHGFRHSHASILFSIPSIDIKDVQMRLGHANPTVTMNIYIHVSKKIKIVAADKFAEITNF